MLAGTLINHRYEIRDPIGEGAMGEVFRGFDQQTGKAIAVKALKAKASTPELIERFRREGDALGQLKHPNIVRVLVRRETVALGRPVRSAISWLPRKRSP